MQHTTYELTSRSTRAFSPNRAGSGRSRIRPICRAQIIKSLLTRAPPWTTPSITAHYVRQTHSIISRWNRSLCQRYPQPGTTTSKSVPIDSAAKRHAQVNLSQLSISTISAYPPSERDPAFPLPCLARPLSSSPHHVQIRQPRPV